MSQYDTYLVSGEALQAVLEGLHTDQERQDAARADLQAALPTSLTDADITSIWNNVLNN